MRLQCNLTWFLPPPLTIEVMLTVHYPCILLYENALWDLFHSIHSGQIEKILIEASLLIEAWPPIEARGPSEFCK